MRVCLSVMKKMPHGYAGRNGHVERMFGAELRYFETDIATVDYRRIDTVDFIADDESIMCSGFEIRGEVLERYAVDDLLEAAHSHALLL